MVIGRERSTGFSIYSWKTIVKSSKAHQITSELPKCWIYLKNKKHKSCGLKLKHSPQAEKSGKSKKKGEIPRPSALQRVRNRAVTQTIRQSWLRVAIVVEIRLFRLSATNAHQLRSLMGLYFPIIVPKGFARNWKIPFRWKLEEGKIARNLLLTRNEDRYALRGLPRGERNRELLVFLELSSWTLH